MCKQPREILLSMPDYYNSTVLFNLPLRINRADYLCGHTQLHYEPCLLTKRHGRIYENIIHLPAQTRIYISQHASPLLFL